MLPVLPGRGGVRKGPYLTAQRVQSKLSSRKPGNSDPAKSNSRAPREKLRNFDYFFLVSTVSRPFHADFKQKLASNARFLSHMKH
jgi:hypothetical protein